MLGCISHASTKYNTTSGGLHHFFVFFFFGRPDATLGLFFFFFFYKWSQSLICFFGHNSPVSSPWCRRLLVQDQQIVGAALEPVFLAESHIFGCQVWRTGSRLWTSSEPALELPWWERGMCDITEELDLLWGKILWPFVTSIISLKN